MGGRNDPRCAGAGFFHRNQPLAAMLDRYCGWLDYKKAVGDVMAEARGKEENVQLGQAYRQVWESGTLMFGRDQHQKSLTSRDIKIQDKRANIAGLQLADILAYPVKQACLVERGWLDDPGGVFGMFCLRRNVTLSLCVYATQCDGVIHC